MAELLGTVASAIAVAEVGLKVGGTVYKLRQLWEEVQEVPERINDLMTQIDIYEPLLADAELSFNDNSMTGSNAGFSLPFDTSIGKKSASYCREALGSLKQLVDELNDKIVSAKRKKRTIAKVKVLLKRDDLKKFQSRLEQAQSLLQASQQGYMMSMVKSQFQMMVQISQQVTPISANAPMLLTADSARPVATIPEQKEGVVTKKSTTQKRTRYLPWSGPSYIGSIVAKSFVEEDTCDSGPTWMARFQPPKWLSHKVWEVQTQQACSGWQINLTVYNMVPDGSDVIEFAVDDNWAGLCQLFKEGRASPYDFDQDGSTLFELACECKSISVMTGLLQTNKIVTDASRAYYASIFYDGILEHNENLLQLLLTHGFLDWVADDVWDLESCHNDIWINSSLVWCPPIEGIFERHLKACLPEWDQLRPSVKSALITTFYWDPWRANYVRRLIHPHGRIKKEDVEQWKEDGVSLIHWTVGLFLNGTEGSGITGRGRFWKFTEWYQLLFEIIQAADGLDLLHCLASPDCRLSGNGETKETDPRSAPMTFLSRFLMGRHFGWFSSCERKFSVLLGALKRSGVDLEAYGRFEFGLWESEYPNGATHMATVPCVKVLNLKLKRRQYLSSKYGASLRNELMYAIHYGPEPEDWFFEWDRCRNWPEVFWNMVENPLSVEVMPGTWVDDNSYYDSD